VCACVCVFCLHLGFKGMHARLGVGDLWGGEDATENKCKGPVNFIRLCSQMEACMVETEKIGSLFASESPSITSFLVLSVFISVDVRTSKLTTMSSAAAVTSSSAYKFTAHTYLIQLMFLLNLLIAFS